MMDFPMHERIKAQLFALYDGELSGAQREEVLAHLAACPACRADYDRWTAIAEAFFRPPQLSPSEAFVRRVMARLEAEEAAREPAPWVTAMRWLAPAVGAGLAALVLTVLVPADESPISTDALLLANAADTGAVERLFVHDAPSADEMLGFTLDQPMEQQ